MAKSVDLSNAFAGAGQAQTIHNLKNRVEELETEISQLKVAGINSDEKAAMEARIQELVTELAAKEGIQEVQVELIERNYLQPRQSFPQHLIQAMAELLKNEGQHTPVILIPQTDGRYLLFDGERRWRAAKLLGWKAIKAVILLENSQLDREELRRKALSTTLHREDLHPLDLAEVLVAEIVYRYPYLQTQSTVTVSIPRILNTAISRLERNGKAAELAELAIASLEIQKEWLEVAGFKACEEADILGIILGLQLNPASVDSNIMPMLKLTEDLKTSVRESGLEASKIATTATTITERRPTITWRASGASLSKNSLYTSLVSELDTTNMGQRYPLSSPRATVPESCTQSPGRYIREQRHPPHDQVAVLELFQEPHTFVSSSLCRSLRC